MSALDALKNKQKSRVIPQPETKTEQNERRVPQRSQRMSFLGPAPSFRDPSAVTVHNPKITPQGSFVDPDGPTPRAPVRRLTMDATLSKALDVMDFDFKEDVRKNRRRSINDLPEEDDEEVGQNGLETDFKDREIKGNSCWRQMISVSTVICIGQVCVLAYIIVKDGMAPVKDNPNYGPSAYSLVKYGARDAYVIVKKGQWYRLFSPICLHAGIIHICTNVSIQLRIGGYLNSLYGTRDWLIIYVLSGGYGSLVSCIFLTNSVGVGSSGALLGLLTSWLVWIIYRWQKIPKEARMKRNLQLLVVSVAIAGTLFFSFTPYVDWATHFGGAGMGGALGLFLLAEELDNSCRRMLVRVLSGVSIVGAFLWAIWHVLYDIQPEPIFPPMY